MSKRLERIGEVCSAGDLSDMLDSIEQDESNTDSRLQEQLSLLLEMVEEWEQCERKIKEVAAWVEKAKSNLESAHLKKKTLRDQLTAREVRRKKKKNFVWFIVTVYYVYNFIPAV